MSRHEEAGVALVGARNWTSVYFDSPTTRGGQFLDPANANSGRDPKLDPAGISMLGRRSKLTKWDAVARLAIELPVFNLIVYGGAVVGIPFDIACRGVSIPL